MTFSQRAVEAAAKALYERSETHPKYALRQMNDILAADLAQAALSAATAVDGVALQGWQDISTAPKDTLRVTSETLLLAHVEKKWVRFGKWYVQEGCWYYSGTNERSQWAQVRGDAPTHWQPLPAPPAASEAEERR